MEKFEKRFGNISGDALQLRYQKHATFLDPSDGSITRYAYIEPGASSAQAVFHNISDYFHLDVPSGPQQSWLNLNKCGIVRLFNVLTFPENLYSTLYFDVGGSNKWEEINATMTPSCDPIEVDVFPIYWIEESLGFMLIFFNFLYDN